MGFTFEPTINLTTIICTVAFPIVMYYFKITARKQRKEHAMMEIKLDAAVDTMLYSANGHGKDLQIYFERRVEKGMKENKFIDGD